MYLNTKLKKNCYTECRHKSIGICQSLAYLFLETFSKDLFEMWVTKIIENFRGRLEEDYFFTVISIHCIHCH